MVVPLIPILYDKSESLTEIVFKKTNGLGRLTDCTTCKVVEERNGSYTLELSYPLTGRLFSGLLPGNLVKAKPNDTADPQLFRIVKVSKPMSGHVSVDANHISYDLTKTSVSPFSSSGAVQTLADLKTHTSGGSAFSYFTDIENGTSRFSNDHPQSVRAVLGGQSGSLLDVFGGEYLFDNLTVKLLAHRGKDAGVTVRYGKNLTDFRQEENIAGMVTEIVPYYQSDAGTVVGDPLVLLETDEDNRKILNLDLTDKFEGDVLPTKEELKSKAEDYARYRHLTEPEISIEVEFVPLWQTKQYKDVAPLERVSLCDTVRVVFPALAVTASAKVVKTDYDVLKERYNSIELGNAKSTLAKTISDISGETDAKVAKASSKLEKAVDLATKKITGGTGGYFIIGLNADGQPNETFWMDSPDRATAVKVLRANFMGLGGSSSGINGPYNTAITTDGQINADAITTGALNAGIMTVGTIRDLTGDNYWNLETGQFRISGKTITENGLATGTELSQTSSDLTLKINANASRIEGVNKDLQDKYSTITKYFVFGENGLQIGMEGNDLTLELDNDRISFITGGNEVAYITGNILYITSARFLERIRIGNFAYIPRQNGNMSLIRVTD